MSAVSEYDFSAFAVPRYTLYCDQYDNIVKLSATCVRAVNISDLECIKNNDDIKSLIRRILGAWAVLITICGTAGNLLTLVAIPHAASHKRYGFHRNYYTTTVFVLHLAFVDLCCCIILGPIYVSMYLPQIWPWGASFCQLVYPIILFFTFIDWASLGLIACTRCINLIKPLTWGNFCDKKRNLLLITLIIWIFGGLWTVPDILEPTVILGWNCENGQCSTIKTESVPILSKLVGLVYVVPSTVVIVSYLIILCHVRKSSKYLRRSSHLENIGER